MSDKKTKRVNNLRKLFDELTPEKREEIKTKRLERIKKLTLEYQLGYYIGEYIVYRYLPTLSIDMLTSRKVISVTSEEQREYQELDDAWFQKVQSNRNLPDSSYSAPDEWDALMKFRREMQNKYLPKKLECHISPLNVENMEELKRGIMSSLWNCDMCHYNCSKTDDIEIILDEDGYFTKIILTLSE
jgi:hypothetical protein